MADNQMTKNQLCHIDVSNTGELLECLQEVFGVCPEAEISLTSGMEDNHYSLTVIANETCDKTQLRLSLTTLPWRWEEP